MEWQLTLLVIIGSFVLLMITGMPIAFCLMLLNFIGAFLFLGGEAGVKHLIHIFYSSVTIFTFLPIPLFILMGEVMFHSGIAPNMIGAVDKWLGRLPGRLSLLAVLSGTLLATLSGASMASVAMLGSVLVPEMRKRGYKKPMSLGPILGSGCLAVMIPPSALAVLVGAIGEISIGKILIAIIIPGILMALLYTAYIIGRCWLQPSIAPPYQVISLPLSEKLIDTARYILPLGFIVFAVVGVIFVGVATPTEAAATGALATFILAFFHRRLNWGMVKQSASGTLQVTVMIFMIIVGAKAFGQILAFCGATGGLVELAASLPVTPILIITAMLVVTVLLGMFVSLMAIMAISLPIYVPVVLALGFDPVWFAVIFLLCIEMGDISPPFGMSLFVMKGVVPTDITMGDIYRSSWPFFVGGLTAGALIILFPPLALWLPDLMR